MTLKDSYSKIKPIRLVFWAQLYVFINQLCLEFEGTNRATVELNLINTPGYFSTLTFATSSPKTPCINTRTGILETHMDAQVYRRTQVKRLLVCHWCRGWRGTNSGERARTISSFLYHFSDIFSSYYTRYTFLYVAE